MADAADAKAPPPAAARPKRVPSPEETANPLSRLLFWFAGDIVRKGYRKTLDFEDLWSLRDDDSSRVLYNKFMTHWEPELAKPQPSLGKALIRTFLPYLAFSFIFHAVLMAATLALPNLIRLLLLHFQNGNTGPDGYLYALGIGLVSAVRALAQYQSTMISMRVGSRMRSAMMVAIYNKALRLSTAGRQSIGSAQVVSYMSNDTQRMLELFIFLNDGLFAPLVLIVILIQLVVLIGGYGALFLIIVVILIPINALLTRTLARARESMLGATDRRTKYINELLGAIKILKLYAWEQPEKERIEAARDTEQRFLRTFMVARGFLTSIIAMTPQLMALLTFLVRIGSDPTPIDPATVFGIIALFNVLRLPLSMLPIVIGAVVQLQVSLRRITSFFLLPEIKDAERLQLVAPASTPLDESAAADAAASPPPADSLSADAGGGSRSGSGGVDVREVALTTAAAPSGAGQSPPVSPTQMLSTRRLLSTESSVAGRASGPALIPMTASLPCGPNVHRPVFAAGDEKLPVCVEDANFSWDTEGKLPALRGLHLRAGKGQLVMVIGSVGSGKSALISALLGEMTQHTGRRFLNGKVAYVPQQAWIVNDTLRQNVLFGSHYDSAKYQAALQSCALAADIALFDEKDEVMIGERGVTLSGGQKQRVSIARAVYSEPQVVLMDDPLSAVDAHVGAHLFEHCIRGALKDATVILATNQLQFLPRADYIVFLDNGAVLEAGTYAQLTANQGVFATLAAAFGAGGGDASALPDADAVQSMLQSMSKQPGSKAKASLLGSMLTTLKQTAQRQEAAKTEEEEVSQRQAEHHTSGSKLSHVVAPGADQPSIKASAAQSSAPLSLEAGVQSQRSTIAPRKPTEAREQGQVATHVYTRYIKSGTVFLFVATLLAFSFENVSRALTEWWIGVYTSAPTALGLPLFLGIYALLGVLNGIFVLIRSFVIVFFTIRASTAMHNAVLNRVIRFPMSFFDTTPVGQVLNRFTKDVDVLDMLLPQTLMFLLLAIFVVLSTLGVMIAVVPWIILAVVPGVVVYFFLARYYKRTSIELQRLESVARGPIFSFFSETLAGLSSIRAYGASDRFLRTNYAFTDRNMQAWILLQITNQWLALRLDVIGILLIFVMSTVLVSLVGNPAFSYVSAGVAGLALSNSLNLQNFLNRISVLFADLETKMNAMERLDGYTELPVEAAAIVPSNRPPVGWPSKGTVHFDDVSMRYRPELPFVVRGVTVDIKAGEKVGVVGRTGAGKSSVLMLLFRLVELAAGSIVIDGVNIKDIGLTDLRSRLAIIPQEPFLFAGTLRENLDPFGEVKDARELDDVLRHVRLYDFVQTLPEKLDTVVSEDGDNFSVGQKQLLCLGRALLRKSRILLMDEATASVDLETDMLIQQTVRTEFKNCTVLTIAHRLNTIMDYDRVLVLDRGSVAEYDSPASLLDDPSGIFTSLVNNTGPENAALLRRIARGEASVVDAAVLQRAGQ